MNNALDIKTSETPVSDPAAEQALRAPVRAQPRRVVQQRGKLADKLQGWFDKIEAFISRLSVRDNFWHSVCSFIWLPLAAFSGIRMKQIDGERFAARLPFKRFNRNWYSAMAGGALLANSEIAGGMYVFGICGSKYTVVCKNLNYTFMRPCLGPAVYHIHPRQSIKELVAAGGEFNIVVDMEILQEAARLGEKDKRVGKCEATFHVTPKILVKARQARRAQNA